MIEVDPRTDTIVWEYADQSLFEFFSPYISGAQRLANGNTLICEGCHGRIFEITPAREVVWEYVSLKVSGCFEVLDLSDYSSLTEADSYILYELFAIGAERRRAKTNVPPLVEKPAPGYSVTWLKDHDIPRYLLRLRANMGAEGQKDFEKSFPMSK